MYNNILRLEQNDRRFQMHFLERDLRYFDPNFICVPKGPNGNKSALVQVMAWRRTGDKPLPEPMMPQFPDAYMCHPASIGV